MRLFASGITFAVGLHCAANGYWWAAIACLSILATLTLTLVFAANRD